MARFPDLDFAHFSIKEMKDLWNKEKILINEEYQRSFIWRPYQRRDLIESIMKGFSIGVLVVWKNKQDQFEILDGQQRIRTILRYLDGRFRNNKNKKFDDLTLTQQSEIEGYSVYYIQLKTALTEEQISDIFTRLQEGTPLNTAEKVNAFRGKFRESFIEAFFKNTRFFGKVRNRRFRARLLAAQFLLLELETDFNKKVFPSMSYLDFKEANEKYKEKIPKKKLKMYNTYINFLGTFLHNEIRAISYRDWISFYLLGSYLHKKQSNREGLGIHFRRFALEFLKNLTSFSIYDTKPPRRMGSRLFKKYMDYKQFGRRATQSDSITVRFNFVLSEYRRFYPFRIKDKIRLFNEEQKIRTYFKQKGRCAYCKEPLNFEKAKGHHKHEHSKGGPTKLHNLRLVHQKCHEEIHKRK